MPVSEVASRVSDATCGAGATLQVTTSGIVTQGNCTNLSTNEIYKNKEIKVYPTVAKNYINFDFNNKTEGNTSIEIYAISGQKIIAYNKISNSINPIKINVENLKKGIYLYSIKNNEYNTSGKFIKE